MIDKLKRQYVFKDPIYGFIHIDYQLIRDLIDTSVFQRLRRIRQLSGVVMVFHGAEHSRFSHCLGVYEVANRFLSIEDIKNNFDERHCLLFLVSALLHDIGHGAYSHAFEGVFEVNHEHVGAKIIEEHVEITSILSTIDLEFASDCASIILHKGKYPLIEQLISSQLDCDRIDYLERDAYFTGTAYGHIDVDRLIRVLFIKDSKIVFKKSGIHAIENYLISRYHMYWQVYYHPVSRAYETILEKMYLRVKDLLLSNYKFNCDVEYIKLLLENKNDIYAYLEIDDYYVNGLMKSFYHSDDYYLQKLSSDFLNRNIWKRIDDVPANIDAIKQVLSSMSKEDIRYFTSSKTVSQSTYKDSNINMVDNIYILDEDSNVKLLKDESSIVYSLMLSGTKSEPIFFYRTEK